MKRWAVFLLFMVQSASVLVASDLVSTGKVSAGTRLRVYCAEEIGRLTRKLPVPATSLKFEQLHLLSLLVKESRALDGISKEWESFVWSDKDYLSSVRSRNPDRRRRYVEAEAYFRVSALADSLEGQAYIEKRSFFDRQQMLSIQESGLGALHATKTEHARFQAEIGAGWLMNVATQRDRTHFPHYSQRHVELLGYLFQLEHSKPAGEWVTLGELQEYWVSKGVIPPDTEIGFLVNDLQWDELVYMDERDGQPTIMYTGKAQGFLRNVFAYFEALDVPPKKEKTPDLPTPDLPGAS